ncbi:MAG: hypothetical protein AAF502_20275 [Bacteroidota bacterium]
MNIRFSVVATIIIASFFIPNQLDAQLTICEDMIDNIFKPGVTVEKKVRIFNPRKPRNFAKCLAMPQCCAPSWKVHPECYIVQKEVIKEAVNEIKATRQCFEMEPRKALRRYIEHTMNPIRGFSGPFDVLGQMLKREVEAAKRVAEPLPFSIRQKLKLLDREYDFPFTDEDIDNTVWISKNKPEAKLLWVGGEKTGRCWFDLIIIDPKLFERNECSQLALWAHELIHVWQTRTKGWDYFSTTYLAEYALHGYEDNFYEKQAYAYDAILEDICINLNKMPKINAFKHEAERSVNMIPLPTNLAVRTYFPTTHEIANFIPASAEDLAVFLTQNFGSYGPYNPSPVGVTSIGKGKGTKWQIKNLNNRPIPKNAKFNVFNMHMPSFNRQMAGKAQVVRMNVDPALTKGHETIIDHPLSNDNPKAQIFITPVILNPLRAGLKSETGVIYRNGRWKIYTQDFSPMPTENLAFNILIIKDPNAISDAAGYGEWLYNSGPTTASTVSGHITDTGYKIAFQDEDLLLVTWNYGRHNKANAGPLGVWPTAGKWKLFNQDKSTMPQNGQFNALIHFWQTW